MTIQYIGDNILSNEIVLDGPFDISGYGVCCRNFIEALSRDEEVRLKVVDGSRSLFLKGKGLNAKIIKKLEVLKQTRISTNAAYVNLTVPELFKHTAFRKNIGYTMYESDGLPFNKVERCNLMDEIWVPTTFNKRTFTVAGVESKKIHVIPLVVDTEKFNPDVKSFKIEGTRSFNFFSSFDFTYRKGWDVLVEAFCREFKKDEDITLIIKTFSGAISTKDGIRNIITEFKRRKNFIDSAPILFFGDFVPDHLMPCLYKTAQVFVLPTRGEGFGLNFAEALATEIPVIATKWSGQLDFLNDENSYLVDIKGLKKVEDQRMLAIEPGYANQHFSEPSVEHLMCLMRHVYDHYSEAKQKAIKGRRDLESKFNFQSIANLIKHRLK